MFNRIRPRFMVGMSLMLKAEFAKVGLEVKFPTYNQRRVRQRLVDEAPQEQFDALGRVCQVSVVLCKGSSLPAMA